MAHALGLGAALSGHGGGEPLLTVAGYASLVDERSARETVPTLRRFRRGTVRDHCRQRIPAACLDREREEKYSIH